MEAEFQLRSGKPCFWASLGQTAFRLGLDMGQRCLRLGQRFRSKIMHCFSSVRPSVKYLECQHWDVKYLEKNCLAYEIQ